MRFIQVRQRFWPKSIHRLAAKRDQLSGWQNLIAPSISRRRSCRYQYARHIAVREFRAGYAESSNMPPRDAGFLLAGSALARGFRGAAERVHADCDELQAKAAIVARDEYERANARSQPCHTFGHAFERITRSDGAKACAWRSRRDGMASAFRSPCARALRKEDKARVEAHLQYVGLPVRLAAYGFNAVPKRSLRHGIRKKGQAWRAHLYPCARIGDCS